MYRARAFYSFTVCRRSQKVDPIQQAAEEQVLREDLPRFVKISRVKEKKKRL
jgi:hypothetical protein